MKFVPNKEQLADGHISCGIGAISALIHKTIGATTAKHPFETNACRK